MHRLLPTAYSSSSRSTAHNRLSWCGTGSSRGHNEVSSKRALPLLTASKSAPHVDPKKCRNDEPSAVRFSTVRAEEWRRRIYKKLSTFLMRRLKYALSMNCVSFAILRLVEKPPAARKPLAKHGQGWMQQRLIGAIVLFRRAGQSQGGRGVEGKPVNFHRARQFVNAQLVRARRFHMLIRKLHGLASETIMAGDVVGIVKDDEMLSGEIDQSLSNYIGAHWRFIHTIELYGRENLGKTAVLSYIFNIQANSYLHLGIAGGACDKSQGRGKKLLRPAVGHDQRSILWERRGGSLDITKRQLPHLQPLDRELPIQDGIEKLKAEALV